MQISRSRALVTGGAAGIGLEVCRLLILRGAASLAVLDVSSTALDAAVEQLRSLCGQGVRSPRVTGYAVDVTSLEQERRGL